MEKPGYLIVRNIPLELSETMGGIPKQVLSILVYLHNRSEFKPIFVTSRDGLLLRLVKKQNISTFLVPELEGNLYKASQELWKISRSNNVKIIQSHMFKESICCRLVKRQHPNLMHIFRVHTHIDCSYIANWKKMSYHIIDYLTQKWVDQFLCIGNYVANELISKSHINKNKVKIIPNGCQNMGEPDSLPRETNSPLPQKIVFISNIIPFKGHDTLIKALYLLLGKNIKPKVRLIGSLGNGPEGITYYNKIKREADKLGVLQQLEFYGKTLDIKKATSNFPILILPSDNEGMPNCILEGMALRKLIIASNVGSIPEMVKDGIHSLLHQPQNPKALADKLELVFSMPASYWNSMRNRAYERFLENYTIETMCKNILKIACELLNQ